MRIVPGVHAEPLWHTHAVAFQMVTVLKGWMRFEYEDSGEFLLRPGDSAYQPPGIRHRELEHSDDMEPLEITSPAEFETSLRLERRGVAALFCAWPDQTGGFGLSGKTLAGGDQDRTGPVRFDASTGPEVSAEQGGAAKPGMVRYPIGRRQRWPG